MPNLSEVRKYVTDKMTEAMTRSAADEVRREYMKELGDLTGHDTVVYASSFIVPNPHIPGEIISINDEDVQCFMSVLHGLSGEKLDIVLHSPGGSINSADQIVQYLRRKYDYIRVIVPQNAMSAATMIACAADEIIMGKQSSLGPTDPIITFFNQPPVSAQSVLDEFEKAKKEVNKDPTVVPLWMPRIANWPPGFLTECEKAIALSQEKVGEWLKKYMFKDDEAGVAEQKAEGIATYLANSSLHKTHGRPLGIDVLRKQGLKIIALEDNQDLQEKVLSVFHAATVTFETTACVKMVENHEGRGVFKQLNLNVMPPPLPQPPQPPMR